MAEVTLESLGLLPSPTPPKPAGGATIESLGLAPGEPGFADRLWSGLGRAARASGTVQLGRGMVEGVIGEGVPEGRASQYEGGRAGFAGRALGAGVRSLADSLWEGIVKPPGKMLAGEMTRPEGEAAARNIGLAMAGMGWRPGMTLPRHQVVPPESPPLLMLPPPTVQVAGQPATSTGQLGVTSPWRAELEAGRRTLGEAPPTATGGVGYPTPWRENLEAGGRTLGEPPPMPVLTERTGLSVEPRVLPAGPQPGMLPPGPTSTMTHPAASPPPTSPRPVSEPAAQPATRLEIGPSVTERVPHTPREDAATVNLYRKAVAPTMGRRRNIGQVEGYEQSALRGVDSIIEARPGLRLTTPEGVALPVGTMPRTVRQFDEAIDQTKTALFERWNPMAEQTGAAGLRIDLAPVVSELRSLARKPETALSNPGVVRQLEDFAALYESQGMVTPLQAQGIIKNINTRLADFYSKGEAASGAPSMVLEPVGRFLRKQLDEGIEAAVGPGWQELRKDYGALSAIERDVTKAVERLAKKPTTTAVGALANFVASAELLRAVVTMSSDALTRVVGIKGAAELYKYLNRPNRMIEQMFTRRMAGPPPGLGHQLDPFVGPGASVGPFGGFYPLRPSASPPRSGGVGYPLPPRASVGGP